MLAGATLGREGSTSGLYLPTRCTEVARVLRRTGAQVQLDPGVEALFRIQLEEIRARRAAETTPSLTWTRCKPLSASPVASLESLPHDSNEPGRLLSTTHGANFSVPGPARQQHCWRHTKLCEAEGS